MIERFDIAGYCRISVDEELDRNQGYTFERLGGTGGLARLRRADYLYLRRH